MATTYRCSGCDRDLEHRDYHERGPSRRRPTMSRCRRCRSEDRYARLYPATCPQCLRHRPLDGDGTCRACNADRGLKECRVCHRLRVIFLDFYAKRRVCIPCTKGLPSSDISAID